LLTLVYVRFRASKNDPTLRTLCAGKWKYSSAHLGSLPQAPQKACGKVALSVSGSFFRHMSHLPLTLTFRFPYLIRVNTEKESSMMLKGSTLYSFLGRCSVTIAKIWINEKLIIANKTSQFAHTNKTDETI